MRGPASNQGSSEISQPQDANPIGKKLCQIQPMVQPVKNHSLALHRSNLTNTGANATNTKGPRLMGGKLDSSSKPQIAPTNT